MIRFESFSRGRYNHLSPRSKKVVAQGGKPKAEPETQGPKDDWATKLLAKHDVKGPRILPRKT